MKFRTHLLSLALAASLIASCGGKKEDSSEKVISTFDDGTPSKVERYEADGTTLKQQVEFYPPGANNPDTLAYLSGSKREGAGTKPKNAETKPLVYREWNYSAGVLNGESRSYYADGKPWSLHTYLNGKKQGKYQTWHKNGQLYIDGQFENDKETGLWKFYDEKGNLVAQRDLDKEPLNTPLPDPQAVQGK